MIANNHFVWEITVLITTILFIIMYTGDTNCPIKIGECILVNAAHDRVLRSIVVKIFSLVGPVLRLPTGLHYHETISQVRDVRKVVVLVRNLVGTDDRPLIFDHEPQRVQVSPRCGVSRHEVDSHYHRGFSSNESPEATLSLSTEDGQLIGKATAD